RRGAELDRRRESLQDRLGDPLVILERAPEVALDRTRQPCDVLDRERLVEAELTPDGLELYWVAVLARKHQHRVDRRDASKCEHADGHEERDRDHEQEATEDVPNHSVALALTGSGGHFASCAVSK